MTFLCSLNQTEGRRFAKGRNTRAPVKTGRVTTLPKPSFKDTTRGDKCTLHMKPSPGFIDSYTEKQQYEAFELAAT